MKPDTRAALRRARELVLDTTVELLTAAAGSQPFALQHALGTLADALAAVGTALGDLASVEKA